MSAPKIIQIVSMPNDACWQGQLLGLGDDGVVYESSKGWWKPLIRPLEQQERTASDE